MIKDYIILFLLALIIGLFILLLTGSMCHCRTIQYKPYTTTYRAYLA